MKLEQVLEEINEQEEVVVNQPFIVNDLDSASEASRRIAYFQEKMAEIDSIIEKQIAPILQKIEKIKEWGKFAKEEHEEKIRDYSYNLEVYMREEIEKQLANGKKPKKTIKLPYGKMSLKTQQPEYQKDNDLLLEYAKSSGYVRIKKETDWAELKKKCMVLGGKLVDPDGEIVPGVVVVERGDKFELKID